MKKKNSSAFTLVEILVAVAIIALIAALGVPMYMSSMESASWQIKQTNISNVEAAKEQWALLNNQPDGTVVTWENIQGYMGSGISSLTDLDVNGDSISINAIGTDASY